jgi:hypothetical protein
MCKGHLMNAPEPLIIGMRNDTKYKRMINRNKTIHGVIDDFAYKRHAVVFLLNPFQEKYAKLLLLRLIN